MRVCDQCGTEHLGPVASDYSLCFDCANERNEYASKSISMSVDAAGDDSTHPSRVKDGTSGFNMALPPVVTVLPEKDAYGQHKVSSRPVANNEVGSGRRLKEMAKRSNLTVMETPKRSVGGRHR